MRYLKIFLLLLIILSGCGIVKPVPVQSITEVHYVDSLRVRDSVVFIPAEKEADIAPPTDTLHLETSLATADFWLDTATNTLKGILQNKKGTTEKYKYRDRIQYRDSIQRVEVPVPVEVVKVKYKHYKYEKYLWMYVVLSLLAAGLYLKLKKAK